MKRVCICVALLAILFAGHAQSGIGIGVKAGANFSTWMGSSMTDIGVRSSYHAGIFAKLQVSKSFLIQPEVLYSDEGTTIPDGKVLMSYIKVPLLFRYQHVSGFHVEAGPQLGIRTRAMWKQKDEPDQDAKNVINPMETSFATGLGFQWSPDWDISFRYNTGLSVVGEGEDKVRSSVIGVSLAYQFRH